LLSQTLYYHPWPNPGKWHTDLAFDGHNAAE
jgi:hypothetical protein